MFNEDQRSHFNERELKEIEFAQMYEGTYNHGTPGHTHLVIIAKLAKLLQEYQTGRLRQGPEVLIYS